MQLALRLGRSLRELFLTVSSEELTMWRAFDLREPIGDWRADLAAGIVTSTFANIHRKEGAPAFAPVDFMPLVEKKKESVAEKLRKALMGHRPKAKT
jgi:hypothetical protein